MFDKTLFELPGAKKVVAVLVGTVFLRALLIIAQSVLLATTIVSLWEGATIEMCLVPLVLFVGSYLIRESLTCTQGNFLDAYADKQAHALQDQAIHALYKGGPAVVNQFGSAAITSILIEGTGQVKHYISLVLPKMIAVVIVPLVILVVVFPLDWVSGIIAAVSFPLIIWYMIFLGKNAAANAGKRQDEFQFLANQFIDALRGLSTIKLFNRGEETSKVVYRASERLREVTMTTMRTATLSGAVLDLFATFGLAAVAVMLGFRLVDGSILFFPALTVLILVPEFFRPIREFSGDYHASLDGKVALGRLRSLVEYAQESAAALHEGMDNRDFSSFVGWDVSSTLAINDMSLSFDDRKIFSHVNLTFQGFQKIALIGPTGSGKSTLLSLLGGFLRPDRGTFTVNSGTPVPSLALTQWQRSIAYIPQRPYIFHASIRDNLMFYCRDATEQQIDEVLVATGLDELISELPEGLDTLIGNGGRVLSGGQIQRIAFGRALLDPARMIWLLDEPTAHLDIQTELELQAKILPLMERKLIVLATHRLHWLEHMDVVAMIDGTGSCITLPAEMYMSGGGMCQ